MIRGLGEDIAQIRNGVGSQGRDAAEAEAALADARAVDEAGAFSMVIEATWESVARRITEEVSIPTIGIGASSACDGQVLVTEDVLGLFTAFTPNFVKRYAELGKEVSGAVERYAADVKSRQFPGPEHCFGVKKA